MLPLFDELTGVRIDAEMVRSQEFITGLSDFNTSEGVIELGDRTIRRVRVLRKPDMHGNFRVAETLHGIDFGSAVESLRVELKAIGTITQVMPEYGIREGN